ncbi:MAG: hypothetical protein JOY71_08890 [Acetobacteraceae bacterium]|nr:hypothetical protein [Acetobacteraceae bacterium]
MESLSAPPIGLPLGVMPILVVAGFKAFGRTVSVRVDGVYAQDLLGFDASRLFLDPGRVAIEVHPAEDEISNYLSEVAYIFNHRRPGDLDEKMRAAVDAIVVWRQTVSEGVKRSGRHTDERRLLLRLLAEAVDFPKLILEQFPAALGRRNGGKNVYRSTLRVLESTQRYRPSCGRLCP